MKCYKFLIFFFIICTNVLAQENFLLPKKIVNFTNGDRATLLIESPLSDEELRKFENTKITDVIYVFKLNINGDEREYEVIFSDPPKKPSQDKMPFLTKGINYKFDKQRAGDRFVIFDSDYKTRFENKYFGKIFCLVLVLLLFLLIYMILRNYSELRKRINSKRDQARKLIEDFEKAKGRSDLELIYQKRSDFEDLLTIDKDNWSKFLQEINKIQFQSIWTVDELEKVLASKKKVSNMELKRGV